MGELAKRVEAAPEADRDLFDAAYQAIHGKSWASAVYGYGTLGDNPNYEKGQAARRFGELVQTQAWLDAAMTFIPDGWHVWALKQDKTGWWCGLTNDDGRTVKGGWAPVPTAALAITAAVMRSPIPSTGDDEDG